ncbi:MFS transporter [Paenibacillus sabuli]|uniref:MFS transporter n=1 Tax=Paenibacillus sabuli TaxID=2772509 RepID=UPI00295C2E15|nr:MFS transporter [Paenibacillus sabuli]
MSLKDRSNERLWTVPFVSLTVCLLLLFLNVQMLLSAFPAYVKARFIVDDVTTSLVTSLFALSAIAARILTARLMRRLHAGGLLLIGIALVAGVTAAYIAADTIGSLLVLRMIYGAGFGLASTVIPTLVSRIIPRRRMGEGIGYFGLSTSLAMCIGPMVGLNLLDTRGFETLAWAGTGVALLIVPVLIGVRPAFGARPQRQQSQLTAQISAAEAAKPARESGEGDGSDGHGVAGSARRGLLLPAVLNVMLGITYSGLLSFIALFGEARALSQVGLFFVFNVVTILIVRPVAGRVFDRRGPAVVLLPAALAVALSMVVLSYTSSLPLLIVSALLYGLGFGSIQPTLQAWMLRVSPPERQSAANSMFYNTTDLGVAAGSFLLGALASASDYAVMYRGSAGVMLLFLLVLSAALLLGRRQADPRAGAGATAPK